MANDCKMILILIGLMLSAGLRAEVVPFESGRWNFEANEHEVVDYLGQKAVRIKGGYATIDDLSLESGLIEFDIAVSPERGFSGAIFRVQDLANYEHFYIRPHQSGQVDANQYTPVINGVSGWQLYHGEGYGAPVSYHFDEWMHVKIAFAGNRAEVFIDSIDPVLIVTDLKREPRSGGVGFGAGDFAPAWFANFTVSDLPEDYAFTLVKRKAPEPDPNRVMSWEVSGAIAEEEVDTLIGNSFEWSRQEAEPTGITNLARAPGKEPGKNTVIARLSIESDKAQMKGLAFGYSDAVTVYINGVPMYSGTNVYQSRDYRYLGTIGLFDRVYLPLKAGQNDVRFAVTEAFGGWGIIARFDDLQGISLSGEP